ncbi:salicylate hydroxylase, partial [Penicillium chermesinum]
GAGLGGLTCAIACRRANPALKVTVIERTPAILTVGAGIHIPPNACRVLTRLGLLEKLKAAGAYQQDFFRLRKYADGEVIVAKPLKTRTEKVYVMHRGDFQRVLLDEAIALGVQILTGAEVVDVTRAADTQYVSIKDGRSVEADVVIGADGLWSQVRDVVLNRPFSPAATGDLAYRGTFSYAQLRALRNKRLDKLLQKSDTQVWLGPGKHAVFYPLRGQTEYNLVLMNLTNGPRYRIGTRRIEDWLQDSLETFLGNYHPHGGCLAPTAPYQGQGAAMAVEDGAILGMLLGKFQHHTVAASREKRAACASSLFELYEDLRKERTKVNVEGAVHTRHYYHLPDGPEQQARDKELSELPSANWEAPCMFNWGDAQYQKDLLGFDVLADAEVQYEKWEKTAVYRARIIRYMLRLIN